MRLVCVFMTSLVRERLPEVLPLAVEAQAFCIRFSRVKCMFGVAVLFPLES